MGFEQDYERGLRDKHWGKSLRAFADGASTADIAILVERAVCADQRKGFLPSQDIQRIALEFIKATKEIEDLGLLRCDIDGAYQIDILTRFDSMCSHICELGENHPQAEAAWSCASEALVSHCSRDFFVCEPSEATRNLIRKYLQQYISSKLRPAIRIAVEKRRRKPKDVDDSLDTVLNKVRFDYIVGLFTGGKKKFIAPPTRSEHNDTGAVSLSKGPS